MIKVLHLLPSVNLMCGDFGVVMNYYRNIDRTEVQFDFGYINDTQNDNKKDIETLGGKVFKLTCPSLLSGARVFIKELENVLQNEHYDILHLHMPTFHKFVKKAIKGLNIKLIIHAHSSKLSGSKLKNFRNQILKIGINKGVDYRFACSIMAGGKWFGENFSNQPKDVILKNAIDFEKFKFNPEVRKEVRNALNIKEEEIAICHIGRFSKEKNHKFLVKLFHEIIKQGLNAKLYLIGVGGLMKDVKRQVAEYGLENKVVFMGFRNDVPNLLKAMDIFLLPSNFEGLSLALIEAQSSGLICFASSNCAKESRITRNLIFIDLNKGEKYWTTLIQDKYKNFKRESVDEQIKDSGYSIKHEANKLISIYKEVLNG